MRMNSPNIPMPFEVSFNTKIKHRITVVCACDLLVSVQQNGIVVIPGFSLLLFPTKGCQTNHGNKRGKFV